MFSIIYLVILAIYSLCYYLYLTYLFLCRSASSALIASKMDKLAVGFSTAEIRLWGIGETVLLKPKHKSTHIPLACDVLPSRSCNDQESAM